MSRYTSPNRACLSLAVLLLAVSVTAAAPRDAVSAASSPVLNVWTQGVFPGFDHRLAVDPITNRAFGVGPSETGSADRSPHVIGAIDGRTGKLLPARSDRLSFQPTVLAMDGHTHQLIVAGIRITGSPSAPSQIRSYAVLAALDPTSLTLLRSVDLEEGAITGALPDGLAVSGTGRRAVVHLEDERTFVVDLDSFSTVGSITDTGPLPEAALTVDDRSGRAYVGGQQSIHVLNLQTGKTVKDISFHLPRMIGIDQPHHRLVAVSMLGGVLIADLATNKIVVQNPNLGGPDARSVVDPKVGRLFIATNYPKPAVAAVDVMTGRSAGKPIGVPAQVWSVGIDSTTHRLLVASAEANVLTIINTGTLKVTQKVRLAPATGNGTDLDITVDESTHRGFVLGPKLWVINTRTSVKG